MGKNIGIECSLVGFLIQLSVEKHFSGCLLPKGAFLQFHL